MNVKTTAELVAEQAEQRKEWITKDSGERAEYDSGMVRDTNKGKPRFELLFAKDIPYAAQMLTRVAALLARGAEKYDARNWEQANSIEEVERMDESGMRHHFQYLAGETDEDHAAATILNIIFAESTKYKLNNRPLTEEEFKRAIMKGLGG